MAIPRNKFRHWLTGNSFFRLIAYWIAIYLSLGFLFALVYWGFPSGAVKSGDRNISDYLEFLYFSFPTQATVGYGDIAPSIHLSRFTTAFQSMLGTALTGLIIGVATFKLVKRSSPFEFPDVLVYDPEHELFWFRFVHYDSDLVRDVKVNVTTYYYEPCINYDVVARSVLIDYDYYDVVPVGRLMALMTKSVKNLDHVDLDKAESKTRIFPCNIKKDSILRIDLSGFFHTTGDAIFTHKDYTIDNIRCGKFKSVDNKDIDNLSVKEKNKYIMDKFNAVISTKKFSCINCRFHECCILDIACAIKLI